MSCASVRKIAIVGAAGELGRRIVSQIINLDGVQTVVTSRDRSRLDNLFGGTGADCRELTLDDAEAAANTLNDCDVIVFCPILSLSAPTAFRLRDQGSRARVILFSSNNVGLDQDAPVYEALRQAENVIDRLPHPWAIIRPTMIYGTPDDGNLGRLMRLARKSPVLPLVGSGRALQQPIHYDDLAALTVKLISDEDWRELKIGAAGPDVCSLRELYTKVVDASGNRAKIVRVPKGALSLIVRAFERLGLKSPLTNAQLARIEIDKLPTWSLCDKWSGTVSLTNGLEMIAQQIDMKDDNTGSQKT